MAATKSGRSLRAPLLAVLLSLVGTGASGQPCTGNWRLDYTFDNGTGWDLCVSHDPREGVLLEEVYFSSAPGERRRVFTQAGLAQIHVPYDDNGARFHDLSDFGIGDKRLVSIDQDNCPGTLIPFTDSLSTDKDVVCHYQEAREPRMLFDGGGAAREQLVIFSISGIGAYNYIPRWTFRDDGSIEVGMGATGRLQRVTDEPADEIHGWSIDDDFVRIAISHVHNFFWRLDFDLGDDGSDDVIEEIDATPDANNRTRTISVERFDTEIARSIEPDALRTWRVTDLGTTNADGHSPSYEIVPTHFGHRSVGPSYEPFTEHDLWFTRWRACERFASHNLVTPARGTICGSDLADFRNGESLVGQDPVVWVGLSFHHVPRDEDDVWMYSHWNSFDLRPRDWTAEAAGNLPASIVSPGAQGDAAGDYVLVQVVATDPEGEPLSYSATGLPAGLSIDPANGVISGRPTNGAVGVHTVAVTVTESAGSTEAGFVWTVSPSALIFTDGLESGDVARWSEGVGR